MVYGAPSADEEMERSEGKWEPVATPTPNVSMSEVEAVSWTRGEKKQQVCFLPQACFQAY